MKLLPGSRLVGWARVLEPSANLRRKREGDKWMGIREVRRHSGKRGGGFRTKRTKKEQNEYWFKPGGDCQPEREKQT